MAAAPGARDPAGLPAPLPESWSRAEVARLWPVCTVLPRAVVGFQSWSLESAGLSFVSVVSSRVSCPAMRVFLPVPWDAFLGCSFHAAAAASGGPQVPASSAGPPGSHPPHGAVTNARPQMHLFRALWDEVRGGGGGRRRPRIGGRLGGWFSAARVLFVCVSSSREAPPARTSPVFAAGGLQTV